MADMANRFISFLMDKYSRMKTPTLEDKQLHDLGRLLLRVSVIVEEAQERHLTNRAMAHQLNLLRKEMYRGYFVADSLRTQDDDTKEKAEDHDVSHSFALSEFNPAKKIFRRTGDTHGNKDLQQVLDNLGNMTDDLSDLMILLNSCPRLYRQPYSMHLFIGKCMFGRQMEMDRIMDFLMHNEHPSKKNVGILPIVGPQSVGKTTLVSHVYNDTRVRNHFSQILVVNGDDVNDENLATLKDKAAIVHQNNTLGENQRLLAIFEFSEDADEVAWNGLFLSFARSLPIRECKMIITSRSNKINKFGTTNALALHFLPPEAYWYFFKNLTFGSADSNDQPRLQSAAMEIARLMKSSFFAANIHSSLLRDNPTAQYWYRHLATLKESEKMNISFSACSNDIRQKNKAATYYAINKDYVLFTYGDYSECVSGDNVPNITVYDIIAGTVKCKDVSKVLLWKSNIVPHKHFIINCKTQKEI